MAVHTTLDDGNVTVGIKGNALLIRWGSGLAFVAIAINPSGIHYVRVDGVSVSMDWGARDNLSHQSWRLGTVNAAIAMAEDIVMQAVGAKRQEDPANGAIV